MAIPSELYTTDSADDCCTGQTTKRPKAVGLKKEFPFPRPMSPPHFLNSCATSVTDGSPRLSFQVSRGSSCPPATPTSVNVACAASVTCRSPVLSYQVGQGSSSAPAALTSVSVACNQSEFSARQLFRSADQSTNNNAVSG